MLEWVASAGGRRRKQNRQGREVYCPLLVFSLCCCWRGGVVRVGWQAAGLVVRVRARVGSLGGGVMN